MSFSVCFFFSHTLPITHQNITRVSEQQFSSRECPLTRAFTVCTGHECHWLFILSVGVIAIPVRAFVLFCFVFFIEHPNILCYAVEFPN